jgi:hypothetical protein
MELDEELWAFCIDSRNAEDLAKQIGSGMDALTLRRWAVARRPIPDSYRSQISESLSLLNRHIESVQADSVAYQNQLMNRVADKEEKLISRFNGFLDGFKNLNREERAALSAYVRESIKQLRNLSQEDGE